MRETEANIKKYKSILPKAKEKVFADLMISVISLITMTSATFAWLTLSWSPEITGVDTTVTANGNLEIALCPEDGNAPGASQVGDSTLPVVEKNVTWGNIVNLADDSYGLANMTLRPAMLNRSSLLSNPLSGATYGGDGRIQRLNADFAYSNWVKPTGGNPGYFDASNPKPGVRAISSVTYTDVEGDAKFLEMAAQVQTDIDTAKSNFTALVNNDDFNKSVGGLIGVFAATKTGNSTANCVDYVEPLYTMMTEFDEKVMVSAGNAYVSLANMQKMIKNGAATADNPDYTLDTLCSASSANLTKNGVSIDSFAQYKADRTNLKNQIAKLKILNDQVAAGTKTTVYWSEISGIVNSVVDINSALIVTNKGKTIKCGNISMGNATDLTGSSESNPHTAIATKGILKNMDQRLGSAIISNKPLKATATGIPIAGTVTVYAKLKTDAAAPFGLPTDLETTKNSKPDAFKGGTPTAEDTYGLAVDFWLRTNASYSYLTLEGKPVIQTVTTRATDELYDENGMKVTVDLYTANGKYTDPNTGEEVTIKDVTIYKKDNDYYYLESYYGDPDAKIPAEYIDGTPKEKFNTEEIVLGYEGENRIWQDDPNITKNSTSQGMGSCYTFYAETPSDMAQSLELLKAMKIALISEDGNILTEAVMDTEHYYAINGRVTVPIVVDSSSTTITNSEGEQINVITALERNVPIKITAVVYLDGTVLTNDKVLSAADIQGQLNLQFGSTADLNAIGNEKLELAERSVTASVDKTEFNYDTDTNMQTNVTVTVTGDQPNSVTATFLRAVNSTQGSREEEITFTKSGDNWVAVQKFAYPGTYVLRTVRLDGVDYDLENPVTVTVKGFALRSLAVPLCDENGKATLLTAESSVTADVNLRFVADDPTKMPQTVQAIFMTDDNVSSAATLKYDSTSMLWTGTVTFNTSGVYKFDYLILDGKYYELADNFKKEITVYVGLKTRIWFDQETKFTFENPVTLDLSAIITDNNGNELEALTDVKLYYAQSGSSVKGLNADLEWNSSRGRYVGQFNITSPGTFNFSRLTQGSNIINVATNAPTINAKPKDPVAYYDKQPMDGKEYQFAPENDASVVIRLAYSSAVEKVYGKMTDSVTGESLVVEGVMSTGTTIDDVSVNNWIFKVPVRSDAQDGNWKLESVKIGGAFYNGDFHEYDPAYEITSLDEYEDDTHGDYVFLDLSGKDIVTDVVSTIYVTFAAGQSKDFGKTGDNVTGTFMDGYTVSGINVKISDKQGRALKNVSDVKLDYTRVPQSEKTYGGYTSSSLTGSSDSEKFTVSFATENGANFTQTGSQTIRVAGEYNPVFSFKVGDRTYSYDGSDKSPLPTNTPTFTVSSQKPTIKFTGISPAPSETINVNLGGGTSIAFVQIHNYFEDFYLFYGIKAEEGFFSASYSVPRVTLKIENAGTNYSEAKMTFPTKINGNDINCDFVFDKSNSTSTAYMGRIGSANSTSGSSTRGTVSGTFSTMTMTYGGVEYTVDLTNSLEVKGSNNVMPKLEYNDATGFEGNVTRPDPITSPDGRNLKVTLPASSTFSVIKSDSMQEPSNITVVSSETANVYYMTSTTNCGDTTYTYYPGTRKIEVQQGQVTVTGTVTPYKVTKWKIERATYSTSSSNTITGWKTVGTYNAGATVTISGHCRAIPVIEQNGAATSISGETRTVTRTVTTYTWNGSTDTKPSGIDVGEKQSNSTTEWQ